MPVLEYAGGIRLYYCWYTNVPGQTRTFNGAFPQLQRVGNNGFYLYYAYYLQQFNNACPLLVRNDAYHYIYYSLQLQSMTGSFPRLNYIGSYL